MEEIDITIKKRFFITKIKVLFLAISIFLIILLSGIFFIKFYYFRSDNNIKSVKDINKQQDAQYNSKQNVSKPEDIINQKEIKNNAGDIKITEEIFTGDILIKNDKYKKEKKQNKKNKKKNKAQKFKKVKIKIIKTDKDIKVFVDGEKIECTTKKTEIIKAFEKQHNKKILNVVEPQTDSLNNNVLINNTDSNPVLLSDNNSVEDPSFGYDKLVEKLASSVVHIKVTSLTDADDLGRYKLLQALDGEVFPAKKIKIQSTCSGFFVTDDGYIATNHHCIDDAQNVDIETKNGNKYDAKIVGYFEGADLAILKITPKDKEKFNAVKMANSDHVAVGDSIIVIGGPLGYKWSASAGIISGKSRALEVGSDRNTKKHAWGTAGEYIQVDAAINGGNSGGPAFNTKGEVVGIAAAGYTFLQGMKFIISSNTLSKNLKDLKNGKIIQKGLWGISVNELEPYDVKAIGMDKNTGMLIHEVIPQSPADKAGLKRGDVILFVNNQEVKDKVALKNINNEIFDGSISELMVNRYGKIKKFKIKAVSVKEIEKLEKGEIGIQDWSDGNLSYRLLTRSMHKRFRLPKDISGIIVTDIKNNDDPLLMIAVGDIIMGVNDKKINSIEDYQKVLKDLKKNKKDMAVFHIYKPARMEVIVKGSKLG